MSKKPTINPHKPHDTFFRSAMAKPAVARDFFKNRLSKAILKEIDFDILELQPKTFITESHRELIADLLYKTRIAGKEAYLYLLVEHQSSNDPLMAFRILKYIVQIIAHHLDQHKTNKIPLILPVVVYHGRVRATFTNNINELVDAPRALVDQYFLKPFQLIDLTQEDDKNLQQHQWAGLVELALKHIFVSDTLPKIKGLLELYKRLQAADETGDDVIEIVLEYFMSAGELHQGEQFFELINETLSPEAGDKIMTLAKQIEQRGIKRGREEGLQEGVEKGRQTEAQAIALKLLHEGTEPLFVARITNLPIGLVKSLLNAENETV